MHHSTLALWVVGSGILGAKSFVYAIYHFGLSLITEAKALVLLLEFKACITHVNQPLKVKTKLKLNDDDDDDDDDDDFLLDKSVIA